MNVEEDYQAWNAYPQYRWVFNKLEIALKLGYDAGPACVPIKKVGWYIVKPIYNLYGMGIGATRKYLDPTKHSEEMKHHKHIPPGFFWCEYLEGNHYSIDFKRNNRKWSPVSAMMGSHITDDNLVTFRKWTCVKVPDIMLSDWIHDIEVEDLNIEFKGKKPFEIHLRLGNDIIEGLNVGDEVFPIWNSIPFLKYKFALDEDLEFRPNMHSESFKYEADGYLKDIRMGYYIRRKDKK